MGRTALVNLPNKNTIQVRLLKPMIGEKTGCHISAGQIGKVLFLAKDGRLWVSFPGYSFFHIVTPHQIEFIKENQL